jgi:hypothetical protein
MRMRANQDSDKPAMNEPGGDVPAAAFIAAPVHPVLRQLLAYWNDRRGARWAPTRADIRPADIKSLLPDVMMWNVDDGAYTMRLVGEHIVRFVGSNNTGKSAVRDMPPASAASMLGVLNRVVDGRAPVFRLGKAYWLQEKSYRDFEACYLPLSSDGRTVDIILGGVKFDIKPAA